MVVVLLLKAFLVEARTNLPCPCFDNKEESRRPHACIQSESRWRRPQATWTQPVVVCRGWAVNVGGRGERAKNAALDNTGVGIADDAATDTIRPACAHPTSMRTGTT